MKNKPKCIVAANGTKSWWLNGKLHRKDGPAIIRYDGHKEWIINGKLISLFNPNKSSYAARIITKRIKQETYYDNCCKSS